MAEAVTPHRLLGAMARSCETARNAVVAVEAAWDRTTAILASLDAEALAIMVYREASDPDFVPPAFRR